MQCESTKNLEPLAEIIGQDRAVRALKFGLGIKTDGFNVYVAGYPGTGRKTAVKAFVEAQAKLQPVPSDWCYVNNFCNPYEPQAIQLPPGKGKEFREDMKSFIENSRVALPKAFESEDYVAKREATLRGLENRRKELIDGLNKKALSEGFVIQTTPIGLLMVPVLDGKPLSDEEMLALPQKTKDKIEEKREKLEKEFSAVMLQLLDMERNIREAIKKLNKEVALYAIGGVNEKIEGFFEVCKVKGLSGEQAVMIPESNVQNLMLKEEVLDAVKAGHFSIYSVKSIDEGIEVLTGVKAGQRQADGTLEEGTVDYLVDKTLEHMADKLKEYPAAEMKPRKSEE